MESQKLKKIKLLLLREKPKKFISDLAITGLYFFDNKVIKYSKELKPSKKKRIRNNRALI